MTRISAPTPYVWVIGRTKTDGPADYPAVHKIQAGYKVTPLSEWGKAPKPVEVKIDPSVDMKTPPKVQVDTMPAGKYFAYAAELLKLHPPHLTDRADPRADEADRHRARQELRHRQAADPAVKKALEGAPEAAQQLMEWKLPTLARVANGWSMNTDTMGVYGNYYLKRAIVAQQGLGANLPEDAIYPLNLGDEAGRPLDGANKYTIHFDKGATPPVERLLVDHALRSGGLPGWQQPQPLRGQQLDAVQDQRRRFARSLFPEREPGQGQGSQLASRAEGRVQSDHAPLRPEIRGAHRQMEPAPVVKAQTLPSLGAQ